MSDLGDNWQVYVHLNTPLLIYFSILNDFSNSSDTLAHFHPQIPSLFFLDPRHIFMKQFAEVGRHIEWYQRTQSRPVNDLALTIILLATTSNQPMSGKYTTQQ